MQGCFPSHLIFLRRHSSQALVTLRRFWTGMLVPSPAGLRALPESADSSLTCTPPVCDLVLPAAEASSPGDEDEEEEDSSSETSGESPESMSSRAAS